MNNTLVVLNTEATLHNCIIIEPGYALSSQVRYENCL